MVSVLEQVIETELPRTRWIRVSQMLVSYGQDLVRLGYTQM